MVRLIAYLLITKIMLKTGVKHINNQQCRIADVRLTTDAFAILRYRIGLNFYIYD